MPGLRAATGQVWSGQGHHVGLRAHHCFQGQWRHVSGQVFTFMECFASLGLLDCAKLTVDEVLLGLLPIDDALELGKVKHDPRLLGEGPEPLLRISD